MRRILILLALCGPLFAQTIAVKHRTVSALTAATPTFNPTGTVSAGTTVTISTATSGCSGYIYHKTSAGVTSGDTQGTSFVPTNGQTFYAKVIGCPGYLDSAEGNSGAYTISATWTLLDNNGCNSPSSGTCTTTAIDTTGADLLVIGVMGYPSTITTAHISESTTPNTWVGPSAAATSVSNCGGCGGLMFWSVPANKSASHTVTLTYPAGSNIRVFFLAFSGRTVNFQGAYNGATTYAQYAVVTNAGDTGLYISKSAGNVGHSPASSPTYWQPMFSTASSTSATVQAASAVTPPADGALILSLLESLNTSTDGTIDSSLAIADHVIPAAGKVGGAIAWKTQTTAAAINPTWTVAGNSTNIGVVTMFLY